MMPNDLRLFIFCLLMRTIASADLKKRSMEKLPITCDAGMCMEGTKATVTCHLDKVDGIIKAMSVVHVPDSYEKGSDRNALICLQSKDWAMDCKATKGFTYDFSMTGRTVEKLTMTIINVTHDFSGYYGCHTIPPMDSMSSHLCRLKVYNRETGVQEAVKQSTNTTNSPSANNTKSIVQTCEQASECHPLMASTAVLAIYSFFATVAVICISWKYFTNRGCPVKQCIHQINRCKYQPAEQDGDVEDKVSLGQPADTKGNGEINDYFENRPRDTVGNGEVSIALGQPHADTIGTGEVRISLGQHADTFKLRLAKSRSL